MDLSIEIASFLDVRYIHARASTPLLSFYISFFIHPKKGILNRALGGGGEGRSSMSS